MNKITSLFVFIVNINGEEKIVMWPDDNKVSTPLVYVSEGDLIKDKMKEVVQALSTKYKIHFELREYTLVKVVESFDPMITDLTM
jgi:hypothetical protein